MDTILVELTIGPVKFQYSLMFIIFLFIGWLTVLFHSRDNFDQPTYELAANEPASIMVPAFLFVEQSIPSRLPTLPDRYDRNLRGVELGR
jgi:hypothetical protein